MPDKTYAKVILNGTTYVDLTSDTVNPSQLMVGSTAHDRTGASIVGTYDPLSSFVYKAGDTMSGDLTINVRNQSTGALTSSNLILGNSYDSTSEAYASYGVIKFYNGYGKYSELSAGTLTANSSVTLPDGSGILALTTDITDSNVLQTVTVSSVSSTYPLLLSDTSHTAGSDPSTITSGARITGGAYYQPSTATLYLRKIHSGTSTQYSRLVLGNAIADGTAGACYGQVVIYGKGSYTTTITDSNNILTASRTLDVPNATGTISLIENLYSITGRTVIPANANLNTAAYTVPGKYYCDATNAATVTGSPYTSGAFDMIVENTAGTSMISIEGVNYNYRRRWLYASYSSQQVYTQICSTNASGVESYGNWQKINMTAVTN